MLCLHALKLVPIVFFFFFQWVTRQSITHSQLGFLTPSYADALSLFWSICLCVWRVSPFPTLSLSLSCEARHRRVKTRSWEKEGKEEKKMRRGGKEEKKNDKEVSGHCFPFLYFLLRPRWQDILSPHSQPPPHTWLW